VNIKKGIFDIRKSIYEADYYTVQLAAEKKEEIIPLGDIRRKIESLRKEMKKAADALEFERAAQIRDKIRELRQMDISLR